VTIVVTNVASAEGKIHVALCRQAEFLKPCRLSVELHAKAGTTTATILAVPPGQYAAYAYHDRNSNGRVDRNLIGLPTEDVGFSNGALKGLRKPEWRAAAFEHGFRAQTVTFALRHF
jgi:uncharacterized protein (DUF2141 family)